MCGNIVNLISLQEKSRAINLATFTYIKTNYEKTNERLIESEFYFVAYAWMYDNEPFTFVRQSLASLEIFKQSGVC